ncbi:MAG: DUF58 domain-containing protein [Lachnospiraceae bacterium]|nr:DUF58 domain-containing protein [Lachnospiraceae bacterium]
MRRNRVVLYVLMISALVAACIRGGSISYTLLYITWGLPIISGLYLLYVCKCFKIEQSFDRNMLSKGETFAYGYTMKNRGIVTCLGIKVNFFTELAEFGENFNGDGQSLLPRQTFTENTTVKVKYRGEYFVGIDSVEIRDYFNLFTIKRRYKGRERVHVMPVIPHYDSLGITVEEHYENLRVQALTQQDLYPDVELRKYVGGDSIKAINWKASAKSGELFSRKYIDETNSEVLLLADFSSTGLNGTEKIILEDKIIEAVLGIADYIYRRNINISAMFFDEEVCLIPIRSEHGMDNLFAECAKTRFNACYGAEELFVRSAGKNASQIVLVTHKLTEKLIVLTEEYATKGIFTDIVYIGDDGPKAVIGDVSERVNITRISPEQEVGDVLDRKA